jgi:ribosomal RNA-processing protein 17
VYVEIKTYEDGGTRITVVTSEITNEDDDLGPKPASTSYAKKSSVVACAKNPSLGVKKQKPPPKRQYRKSKTKSKKVDTSRRKNKGKK